MAAGERRHADPAAAGAARFPPRRTVSVFANPAAGGFPRKTVEAVADGLRDRDCFCEIVYTSRAGEIAERLDSRHLEFDTRVVCGGDGTIAEAVAGLHLRTRPAPALAVIPAGTANVLAHELGLPFEARAIVAMIAAGATRPLYYGLANGRPFVLMVSAGFDAATVHRVSPLVKRRIGRFAFLVAAIDALRNGRTCDVEIETDAGTCRGRLAIVANSSLYGGAYAVARQTAVDKEGLSLVALPRDDVRSLLRIGRSMLTGAKAPPDLLREKRVRKVRLCAGRPVPVQIDGDAFGFTPVEIAPVDEPLALLAPS